MLLSLAFYDVRIDALLNALEAPINDVTLERGGGVQALVTICDTRGWGITPSLA